MIPDPLQLRGVDWILNRPYCALWWRAGVIGKTYPTLLAIWELLQMGEVNRVLVLTTKYVAKNVWTREINKVPFLRDTIDVSVAVGTPKQRIAAIEADSDVVTINNENLKWLVERERDDWPFDMVVIDESSRYSNPDAVKVRALSVVLGKIDRLVQLTGSPHATSLLQVWAQVYLLDRGERLGATFSWFRERYFKNPRSWEYAWTPRRDAKELIYDALADICFVAEPKRTTAKPVVRDVTLELPPKLQKEYKSFLRHKCMLWGNQIFDAKNASGLRTKLMQFANGLVYNEEREAVPIHDLKLDLLREMINEYQGDPVLVAYHFRYDRQRLVEAIPGAVHFHDKHYDAWNRGEIPVMLFHPASSAHGLNLQMSAHNIIFYSLPDSLENYEQTIARLDRRGQTKQVVVRRIITTGTVEEGVAESLEMKDRQQQYLFDYMCKLVANELGITLEELNRGKAA